MAIYKRGQIYWYKFTFNGEATRESTRQKNQLAVTAVGRNMRPTVLSSRLNGANT
jgi:hypothetical protein